MASRVEEAIHLWTVVLANDEFEDENDERGSLPVLQPIVLEMRVTSQVMYINPSIEQARAHLLDQLFAWQSVVTNQPRISSTRFQVKINVISLCFCHCKLSWSAIADFFLNIRRLYSRV